MNIIIHRKSGAVAERYVRGTPRSVYVLQVAGTGIINNIPTCLVTSPDPFNMGPQTKQKSPCMLLGEQKRKKVTSQAIVFPNGDENSRTMLAASAEFDKEKKVTVNPQSTKSR